MKGKLCSKFNRKTIGILIVLLTAIYLFVATGFAQSETKRTETTGIEYKKDHLSYGDIWAFDSDAHAASNYSKSNTGANYSYYTSTSKNDDTVKSAARTFYSEVETKSHAAPTGTAVPARGYTLFNTNTELSTVTSLVNDELKIPVVSAKANNALYSVVPDSTGTYYVYVYSEAGAPKTMYYSIIDSPEKDVYHTTATRVDTLLDGFEPLGNNWYRAEITVEAVKWHAVYVDCTQGTASNSTADKNTTTYTGGQDSDMSLGSTYYYNTWNEHKVYYNTVIVFRFSSVQANVKLGPITKVGDTITITNTDVSKGTVTAQTVFGDNIEVGKEVELDHCPIIITPSPSSGYMLDEVQSNVENSQLTSSGNNYVYYFEDTSELSVTWTKMVNLPTISVAVSGSSTMNMNFFGLKTANITHPAGTERNYTFTADFTNASDLDVMTYEYVITDLNGKTENKSGTLSEGANSFSVLDVCYKSIAVTFTATDKEGKTFTATCTIDLSAVNATAPFKVGSNYYFTWEQALAAAGNNGTVILNNNYTLPDSLLGNGLLSNGKYVTESNGSVTYRLPSNMTFIVPHSSDATSVKSSGDHPYALETQGTAGATALMTSVYRTLTVSSGASINLESSSVMAVGGTTNGSCQIAGAHANVHLEENAQINVASGARLSTCGYIYGEGTVNAENGSYLYMPFSILDFHGGGYTVSVAGKLTSANQGLTHPSRENGLSPFIRYTMNAIQSKLVIKYGATLIGYLDLFADSTHNTTNANIIGKSSGLIIMENGSIEVTYDADTYVSTYSTLGKTTIKIFGDAKFGNLGLTIPFAGREYTVNTNQVNFPIPFNFDIEIVSGTFTVPSNVMLLPGSSVIVGKNATMNVNASVTVYDGLHDYTSDTASSPAALLDYVKGTAGSKSDYSNATTAWGGRYPTTADLRSATFGGSGSADFVVNGTLYLNSGAIGGVIQTGSSDSARIITAAGIGTSTITQIGAVGDWSYLIYGPYYFAGATVRTLQGQIIDTGTGERVNIKPGLTYQPSAGAANISSYTYTLYYDSYSTGSGNNIAYPHNIDITEEVACILQGSWYNYAVQVYTVDINGQVSSEPTMTLYFADGANVSDMGLTTDQAGTNPAITIHNGNPLYFNVRNAQARIEWADGSPAIYYPLVRNAVTDAVHKGDKVVLMKDIDNFSSVIGPSATQDFTFDMDGHKINYRSTPFASNSGSNMIVDVNGGTITNIVNGIPYDNPVLLVGDDSSMTFLLNGGEVSVTGSAARPLTKSSAVSNSGTLIIDLGGGTWEYKTGLEIKKSSEADNQTHDYTALADYRAMAAITNAGTLTIKDSSAVGNGRFITDLIQDSSTLTPATPTTNYVSVIKNNAGATLYLDGGALELEAKKDADGGAILSTAATHVPLEVYGAVVLNYGDISSHATGSAVSMKTSAGHALYNFKGGTVDLDLRGGTIEIEAYTDGIAANPAMYNKATLVSATIVNDGEMTLRDSTGKGVIRLGVSTTSGNPEAVRNSSGSIVATLTLDGVNIETTQTLNNNTYALYNAPGSTIEYIKNTNVTSVLGYAVYSPGTATLPSKIGDITDSTFKAGTTEAVNGTHGFYTAFTTLGNITRSTFENESIAKDVMALRVEGNIATLTKVGNITDSHFKGGAYGFYATYGDIGEIKNSTFTGGINYALAAISYSTIKSISGGKIETLEGGTGGGLSLSGTAASATSLRLVSTIPGGITGTEFNTAGIGISLSHADIGNLNHVIIKTQTGNGITATNGCIIGDITDCEITSGVYDEETGTWTTGGVGLNIAGVKASGTIADAIDATVGNITDSTFVSKGNGITIAGGNADANGKAAGSKVGDITGCTFNTGAHGIAISGGTGNATGGAAAAPTVGNIVDCNITAATYGISVSGHPGVTNFPDHAFATVCDITGNTVKSGTVGIYLSYANADVIENCKMTSTTLGNNSGVIHVTNRSSVDYIKDTNITIESTSTSTSAAGIYTSASDIGDIIHCEITASKGPAISHNATAALGVSTIGNITDCTIVSGAGGISAVSGAASATMPAAAPAFGNIVNTTFDTGTYGISMAGAAANATGGAAAAPTVGNIIGCKFTAKTSGITISGVAAGAGGAAAAPTVGDITDCTFNVQTYGINIGGGAVHATGGGGAAPTVGNITDCTINAVTYGIQIAGAVGNTNFPHAFATVGDFTGNEIYVGTSTTAGAYYGIYLSYANAGKIEECTLESGISANTSGVVHVTNRSSVEHIKNTDITVKDTSTNTGTAGIYTSASAIGDIINCNITSSKGPAISHNATAALGVSTIGNISDCTIKSGAGGIAGASGQVTQTALGAAPVFGDIVDTTFETVTYGINITGSVATANGDAVAPTVGNIIRGTFNVGSYGINITGGNAVAGTETTRGGVGAGPTVGKITDCTINTGTSYGIQIAGGAGTLANNYEDVGFAKVGDITGTTVNSGTYSILLNYCKGGVIENCGLNAVSPASNANLNFALGNLNGSEITRIVNTSIKVTSPAAKVYGIYNNGGKIGLIEKSPIDAPYGIYNANTRSSTSTAASGEFVVYAGHIGTIKDTDITVAQYAIANRGVIDEIIGKCTFIAANPSAQVPSDTARYANSNAAGYTIYNYNTWWADQTVWRRTDTKDSEGRLTRTDEYLWDDDHRPTIGKISGDIQIIALNTSTTASSGQNNGVALYNAGVIKEISGNVLIDTHVHPDNTAPPAYSAYAIQNTAGGRIDAIKGNVKITAGAYAVVNTLGTIYEKNVTTYTASTVNDNQATDWTREFHYDYVGIGEITGDMNGDGIVIEATASGVSAYAIQNTGRMGDITGKVSITADNGGFAIQNSTSTTANIISTVETKPGEQKVVYEEFMIASMGTIGGGDSEILIRSAGNVNSSYTLHNNGYIKAILEGVTIETSVGYNNMPTIANGTGAIPSTRKQTVTVLGESATAGHYDFVVDREYSYHRSTIGEIRGVKVSTAVNYALRNYGYIGSITDSEFTAVTGYGIVNWVSNQYYYTSAGDDKITRKTVNYLHGATPIATSTTISGTAYVNETSTWYINDPAEIGKLDNVTITVTGGGYGLHNMGKIGPITNTDIEVSGSYAIHNVTRPYASRYENTMDGYITKNAAGAYAANAITDSVAEYPVPTIESIGEGSNLTALSQTIYNSGYIGEIGSDSGERTTITAIGETANSSQYAIYNSQGLISKAERLGVATDTNTYAGAEIGIIRNASVNSQNSVAIYNGAGTANTYHPVIKEIAEGTEVTSVSANAVYNHATNSEIEKITGGIFTTGEGNYYALYNSSTAYPIEVSGGCFKGGAADRAHAIFEPDKDTRYTYPTDPEELVLSYGTKKVTFADGSTEPGYYFITKNVLIILFDGNGATDGEMEQMEVPLKDLEAKVVFGVNGFVYPDYTFQGWADNKYASVAILTDRWSGTVAELQTALKGTEAFLAGEEITLYAVWTTDQAQSCTITWGELVYTYTRAEYEWDAYNTMYKQTNAGEDGWSANGNNTITIKSIGSSYNATLTFNPLEEKYYTIGMDFYENDSENAIENNTLLIPANSTTVVTAMLNGRPIGEANNDAIGTVTVEISKP